MAISVTLITIVVSSTMRRIEDDCFFYIISMTFIEYGIIQERSLSKNAMKSPSHS